MARETFIDTSGFFALVVKRDAMHARSLAWLNAANGSKKHAVTTDYVLDETATLLKVKGFGHLIRPWFDRVKQSEMIRIEWMDEARFNAASEFFFRHADHDYSFTDCTSFVVMRELGLVEALAKDKHFAEAGFRALLLEP
jgi:uncharacterized protein